MSELPKDYKEHLLSFYDEAIVDDIISSFVVKPTTFRINTIKAPEGEVLTHLRNDGFELQPYDPVPSAYILLNKTKRELTSHELHTCGKIYIQSLASMMPVLALNPLPGEIILDLTAAPGSKTSQIAALMKREGELVANDNNKSRFFRLKRNLELQGCFSENDNFLKLRLEHGVKLCREYKSYFDKILLDAPCSAESRFIIGNEKTFGYWKKKKMAENAKRQRTLLLAALGSLKPGGTLIYSTCTISPEENEGVISWVLGKSDLQLAIEPVLNLESKVDRLRPVTRLKDKDLSYQVNNSFRIKPNQEIESFFIAKIRNLATSEVS